MARWVELSSEVSISVSMVIDPSEKGRLKDGRWGAWKIPGTLLMGQSLPARRGETHLKPSVLTVVTMSPSGYDIISTGGSRGL